MGTLWAGGWEQVCSGVGWSVGMGTCGQAAGSRAGGGALLIYLCMFLACSTCMCGPQGLLSFPSPWISSSNSLGLVTRAMLSGICSVRLEEVAGAFMAGGILMGSLSGTGELQMHSKLLRCEEETWEEKGPVYLPLSL